MEVDDRDQDSWASASSHISLWSRDDDTLSFESLSLTSVQSTEAAHSIVTDGPQSALQYNHRTPITDVTVSQFANSLYILDDSGIVTWNYGNRQNSIALQFPPYKHKLLSAIIYSEHFNVLFILTATRAVKVLNKDFSEVHTLKLPVEQPKVSCIAFNGQTHQLIAGCLGGIKIFDYRQQRSNWKVIKPMAQYQLVASNSSDYTEGVWIRHLTVSTTMDWLIGFSGCDLLVYTFDAILLLNMKRLHYGHVTGCVFASTLKYFVTCSEDASVKVWSESGAFIASFSKHVKEVTAMIAHPHCPWLVLTCSSDATIKLWNLITLQLEYSLTSSVGGGRLMGVVNKNYFYVVTASSVDLLEFNHFTQFWSLSYCKMSQLLLVLREQKAPQILARGADGSVRVYSSDAVHLTTVLPSHHTSSLMGVAYSAATHVLCTLVDSEEVWMYSTRFNPCCRLGVWHGEMFPADKLLASVLPAGIRLEHRMEFCSICACGAIIALGMFDGRVVVVEPVEEELKTIGYLQAFVSPITLLKFDGVLNTLICASNRGDDICIQLWDVANWTLSSNVQCGSSELVDCALLDNCMMTGHGNGALSLFRLSDSSSLNNNTVYTDDSSEALVTSVQSSHSYMLFASSHCSNIIRLWNNHYVLLLEVSLATSLHGCCFLPGQACIILSLHHHLYKLMLDKVLPQSMLILQKETIETARTSITATDSVIIDDLTSSHDLLTVQQYLTGAGAMATSQIPEQKELSSHDDDTMSDDESSELSAAASNTYRSPLVSPVPSTWCFPSLGISSPTDSYEDLSHEGSMMSLIMLPAEEHKLSQTDHQPSNKVTTKPYHQQCQEQVVKATMVIDKFNNVPSSAKSTMIGHNQNETFNLKAAKLTEVKLRKPNVDLRSKQIIVSNKIQPVKKVNRNVTMATLSKQHLHRNKKKKRVAAVTKFDLNATANVSDNTSSAKGVVMETVQCNEPTGQVMAQSPAVVSLLRQPEQPIKLVQPDKVLSSVPIPMGSVSSRESQVDQQLSVTGKRHSEHVSSCTALAKIESELHEGKVEVTSSKKSKSTIHSFIKDSISSTASGWQFNAIERDKWKHYVNTKRHEDAQLHRVQRDNERRLIKSAGHLTCHHATRMRWQFTSERPWSVMDNTSRPDLLPGATQCSSFHEHKLNCTDYRLQIYDHEK